MTLLFYVGLLLKSTLVLRCALVSLGQEAPDQKPTPFVPHLNLTILHTNDVHCRFLSYNARSRNCEEKDLKMNRCWGGAARRMTLIKKLRAENKNVLFLDAGDQYQGTIWFTALKWEPIARYMNLIGYDAMCLGNHDFDDGPTGLAPFLRNISCPVVASNLYSATGRPTPIDGLYSRVLNFSFPTSSGSDDEGVTTSTTVAIVGYTSAKTAEISHPGPDLVFADELDSLRRVVGELTARGVDKIIALGHSGISTDRAVCRRVKGVDVVVGGHTNTFLYSGDRPPSDEKPEGPYPEVYNDTGDNCLVVQAYAYGKYVGFLQAGFDERGVVRSWRGNPILVDSGTAAEDPAMSRLLEPYARRVADEERTVVGRTAVDLDTRLMACKRHECPAGNLVCDAFLDYFRESGRADDPPTICLINSGGLREIKLDAGQNVTVGDLLTLMPFSDTIQRIKLKGRHLLASMERSVASMCEDDTAGKFLQVAGLRVVFDLGRPDGRRVTELRVVEAGGWGRGSEPVDPDAVYELVTNSYIIEGGNGYTMIRDNLVARDNADILDVDVMRRYLKKNEPSAARTDGRIRYVNDESKLCAGSSSAPAAHFPIPRLSVLGPSFLALKVAAGRTLY